jgi:hypothetical protein
MTRGCMSRLVIRSPQEPLAREFADHLGKLISDNLARHGTPARVLGPAPAPIAKLRGQHRSRTPTACQPSGSR